MIRVLTEVDLTPHGILCEACGREMRAGDEMVFGFTAMIDESPILGDGRCRFCFDEGRTVPDTEAS